MPTCAECKSFYSGSSSTRGLCQDCEDARTDPAYGKVKKSWSFYTDALHSEECHCGRPKKRGHAFCYKCYQSLSNDSKKGLWCRLGDGFEQSYDEAVRELEG